MNQLIQRGFLNAMGTVAYIALIATIMQNGSKIFGETDSFLTPIAVLTMFVLSAAITGSLILGKPVLMYLNGAKSEAIKLFLYTLAWLAVMVIILFLVMLAIK